MIDNFVSFLAAVSVALAVFASGRATLLLLARFAGVRLLARRNIADSEGIAWSIGLGLVVCGAALGAIAAAGILRCEVLAPLTLLAATWGLWQVFCAIDPIAPRAVWLGTHSAPGASALAQRPARFRPIVPLACGLVVIAATLIGAMAPPISASVLTGPVERSKTLLLDHGFATAAEQTAAAQSTDGPETALGDLFLAWPMALDGVVAAGLVQWMLGLTLALAVWALASPIVGARAATVSAALVLLEPQTWRSMTEPVEGLVFAIFAVLALAAMWRAVTEVRPRPWLYVAAIMAAGIIALEPLAGGALVALATAAAGATALRPKETSTESARPAPGALRWSALVAPCIVLTIACGGLCASLSGLGGSAAEALLAHFGPLPLVVLPAVLLCNGLIGARWTQIALAGAFCCGLFATGIWWALAPLVAVIAGWLWTRLDVERAWPCRFAVGLLSALAIASAMPAVIGAAADTPVALGLESREQYLARRLEGYPQTMLAGLLVTPPGELISDSPARAYAACRTAAPSSGRVTRAPGRVAR